MRITEKLALEQVAGDGRAVDGDKRPPTPVAHVMDALSEEFLSGAGCCKDEDGAVAIGEFFRRSDGFDDGGSVANDVCESGLRTEAVAVELLPHLFFTCLDIFGPLQVKQSTGAIHALGFSGIGYPAAG